MLLAMTSLHAADLERDAAGIPPPAQAALAKGVRWLVEGQDASGNWPGSARGSGLTGIGLLALLAAGEQGGRGDGGRAIQKAVASLVTQAQPDGLIFTKASDGAPMYHHGLATLALGQAWGSVRQPGLRDVLVRAVDKIVTSQNPQGGWRYQPKPVDADISVTVMQLLALRSARDAGVAVPEATMAKGLDYVRACWNDPAKGLDGGFGYTPKKPATFSSASVGLTSLLVGGASDDPRVPAALKFIAGFQPIGEQVQGAYWQYGQYYCAHALYHAQHLGPDYAALWQRWYAGTAAQLVGMQRDDGSWGGNYEPFPTAAAMLALAVPLHYLPVFHR